MSLQTVGSNYPRKRRLQVKKYVTHDETVDPQVGFGNLWVTCYDGWVSRINLSNDSISHVNTGGHPASGTSSPGFIWFRDANALYRIDSSNNLSTLTISGINPAYPPAYAFGSLWCPDYAGTGLYKIDPSALTYVRVTATVGNLTTALAAYGSIWCVNSGGSAFYRVDPTSNAVTTLVCGAAPIGCLDYNGSIWIACGNSGTVTKVNPSTNATTTITTGSGSVFPVIADGYLWVANPTAGTVTRIDPNTNATTNIITGTTCDEGFEFAGAFWVCLVGSGIVKRIDPVTLAVTSYTVGAGIRPPFVYQIANWRLGQVYIPCHTAKAVYQIDPVTGRVVAIPTGGGAWFSIPYGGYMWTTTNTVGEAAVYRITPGY